MFALVLRGLGGDELIEGALKGLPYGPNGVVIVVSVYSFYTRLLFRLDRDYINFITFFSTSDG